MRHGAQVGDGAEQRSALLAELREKCRRLITSADRRLAAISNVVRARAVLEQQVEHACHAAEAPLSLLRSFTLTKLAAVSRMCVTMSRGRPRWERWISLAVLVELGLRFQQHGQASWTGTGSALLIAQTGLRRDWLPGATQRQQSASHGQPAATPFTSTARRTLAGGRSQTAR